MYIIFVWQCCVLALGNCLNIFRLCTNWYVHECINGCFENGYAHKHGIQAPIQIFSHNPTKLECMHATTKILPLQSTSSSKRLVSSNSSSAFSKSTCHNLINEKVINNVVVDCSSKLRAIRPILTNHHKGVQVNKFQLPLAQDCDDSYDRDDVLTLNLVASCLRFLKYTSPRNQRLEIDCNLSSTKLEVL